MVKLVVLPAPPGYPIIEENPSLKAVEKGRNAVLQCTATGDPPPRIYWLKDFLPVNLQDERITLLSRGKLPVSLQDERITLLSRGQCALTAAKT